MRTFTPNGKRERRHGSGHGKCPRACSRGACENRGEPRVAVAVAGARMTTPRPQKRGQQTRDRAAERSAGEHVRSEDHCRRHEGEWIATRPPDKHETCKRRRGGAQRGGERIQRAIAPGQDGCAEGDAPRRHSMTPRERSDPCGCCGDNSPAGQKRRRPEHHGKEEIPRPPECDEHWCGAREHECRWPQRCGDERAQARHQSCHAGGATGQVRGRRTPNARTHCDNDDEGRVLPADGCRETPDRPARHL